MKEHVLSMLYNVQFKIRVLKKEKMTLTDRIAYEKALDEIDIIRDLIRKFI